MSILCDCSSSGAEGVSSHVQLRVLKLLLSSINYYYVCASKSLFLRFFGISAVPCAYCILFLRFHGGGGGAASVPHLVDALCGRSDEAKGRLAWGRSPADAVSGRPRLYGSRPPTRQGGRRRQAKQLPSLFFPVDTEVHTKERRFHLRAIFCIPR